MVSVREWSGRVSLRSLKAPTAPLSTPHASARGGGGGQGLCLKGRGGHRGSPRAVTGDVKRLGGGYWRLGMRLGRVVGYGNAFGAESVPECWGGGSPLPPPLRFEAIPLGGGGGDLRIQRHSPPKSCRLSGPPAPPIDRSAVRRDRGLPSFRAHLRPFCPLRFQRRTLLRRRRTPRPMPPTPSPPTSPRPWGTRRRPRWSRWTTTGATRCW